jgi:dihydropteroate synthase
MPDLVELEERMNPLFTSWVREDPASAPEYLRVRLEGLTPGEAGALQACARETGLGAEFLRRGEGPALHVVSGRGEAFTPFLDALSGADGGTAEVLRRAHENRLAFGSAPYALAEGVVLEPGKVQIWGVLNVTPDSFSDGGRFHTAERAFAQAESMVEEGASVLDVGGESTRPGAEAVGEDEERRRVLPVIERIRASLGVPVSIDTTKASVARDALAAGAVVVNDVTGLAGDPEMADVVAGAGAGAVLMHMRGTPRTMQKDPRYGDLLGEVARVFRRSLRRLDRAGGAPALLDPGIGFGKTIEHNLRLIRHAAVFGTLGRPVLLGPSRKSFLGSILDLPVEQRLEGTAAAVASGILAGAGAVRVHDVGEMRRVARVAEAIRGAGGGPA